MYTQIPVYRFIPSVFGDVIEWSRWLNTHSIACVERQCEGQDSKRVTLNVVEFLFA